MSELYDVVVLGTGAAGLMAAISASDQGARVGIFEKSDRIGGSTALSSGIIWLPANKYAAAAGHDDTAESALEYLRAVTLGTARDPLLEAFVKTVPELIEYLESRTPLRLRLVPRFPDYLPEHPGGRPAGGRSLESELYDTSELGEWRDGLEGMARHTRFAETAHGGDETLDPALHGERVDTHVEGLGRSLVAALLKGCLDRGIEPQVGAAAVDIVADDTGVRAVLVDRGGEAVRVTAGAVVLATGGFESDPVLRRAFLRGPIDRVPGVASNTGDGLRMAMALGAAVDCMPFASWAPIAEVPDPSGGEPTLRLVLRERALPGSILVNEDGKRFADESASYNALGGALHNFDPARFGFPNREPWLVFDQRYLTRFGFFDEPAGAVEVPWAECGTTLHELAMKIGVPSEAFTATVERWNEGVERGVDADFARGASLWDGWDGDRSKFPSPQATLGSLDTPPFYAIRIQPSLLGTKGGPTTDADARVLRYDGSVVPGLFAAGNVMAAPTGMGYGGAGGTLGPALVFGYRAGRAAASGNTAR